MKLYSPHEYHFNHLLSEPWYVYSTKYKKNGDKLGTLYPFPEARHIEIEVILDDTLERPER